MINNKAEGIIQTQNLGVHVLFVTVPIRIIRKEKKKTFIVKKKRQNKVK